MSKRCCTCKLIKPVEEFYVKIKKTGELQPYCKPCKLMHNKRWYRRNREAQLLRVKHAKAPKVAAASAVVAAAKDGPCTDCGQRFPTYAMDFDHVRGEKVAAVSVLVSKGASEEIIREELAKCELVCANCHRIRTFSRPDAPAAPPDAQVLAPQCIDPGDDDGLTLF